MNDKLKTAPVGWLRPKGICYVNDANRIIFLTVPKNASTSIRKIPEIPFYKSNIMSFEKELVNGEYRAFTVIRDPVRRFVSSFIEVCLRATVDSPHILAREFYWANGKDRFVKFVEEVEREFFDIHTFPQRYFLTDYQDRPFKIDAYIDIDRMEQALPRTLEKFGAKAFTVRKLNVQGERRTSGFSSSLRRKIDLRYMRRSLYYLADAIVRKLQYKRLPSTAEVFGYIRADSRLSAAIERLVKDDIDFVNNIKTEYTRDEAGVYWRKP